ncbi:hypothetical protein J437_LFUL006915 [Ladona fulva]|uniref:Pleckstrin homology domain-containing family J member 1 n=1 Tax=Ladona fulva TaxID=123851 RepID=A0A8K0K1F1_LADFU|nr:hypothetical protein J437_LFUL006915 [Ladona fulva]
MRFNDRELVDICSTPPTFEGRLNYRPPGGSFGQSGFRERWFRLNGNLLFYLRISETGKVDSKPSGVFVLENSYVQLELSSSIPFAFSITFKDEPDKKHIFSGRSDANVLEWITSLKHCTYEYLRTQRILLQKQITQKTGKDPLLMYPYNEGVVRDFQPTPDLLDDSAMSFKPSIPKAAALTGPLVVASQTYFQSHVKPLVPQQVPLKQRPPPVNNQVSVPKQTSFRSHLQPAVPMRAAPAIPLPNPEVQSQSSGQSRDVNLIQF